MFYFDQESRDLPNLLDMTPSGTIRNDWGRYYVNIEYLLA